MAKTYNNLSVEKGHLSRLKRCTMVFTAWVVAALFMAVPTPSILGLFWAFPLGITEFFHYIFKDPDGKFTTMTMIGVAWMCYIALSVAVMVTRRIWSLVLYVILCVVLALNVVGCHKIAERM